jgi:hypothetical protein
MSVRPPLVLVTMMVLATPGTAVRAQQIAHAASAIPELDSATQAAVVREVALARTRGLPVQPLIAKVREGQIKRATPDRIRRAVAALATRLDSARTALGTTSSTPEVIAGADAIAAGVDMASLRLLRAASGTRDVSAPLGALAQLVASGVPLRRATQMILELVKRDARPSEMLAFGIAVESDVGAGVPAEESAVFRLRAIESQSQSAADRLTNTTGIGEPATVPLSGDSRRPRRKP